MVAHLIEGRFSAEILLHGQSFLKGFESSQSSEKELYLNS